MLVLTRAANFAQKIEFQKANFSPESVVRWTETPDHSGGGVWLKGGTHFSYLKWGIDSFERPHAFYYEQNPLRVKSYYGEFHVSPAQAATKARQALLALGYKLQDIYVDGDPEIIQPDPVGTNTLPYYKLTWLRPNVPYELPTAEITVNGKKGVIESVSLLEPPPSAVPDDASPTPTDTAPPAELAKWPPSPEAINAIREAGRKLDFPDASELVTNSVTNCSVAGPSGQELETLRTVNGFTFVAFEKHFYELRAPGEFFNGRPRIRISDFSGPSKFTDDDAERIARHALLAVGATKSLVIRRPFSVTHPFGKAAKTIPRVIFQWQKADSYDNPAVEVDKATGSIKYLKAY
jgi:hypothetical protein